MKASDGPRFGRALVTAAILTAILAAQPGPATLTAQTMQQSAPALAAEADRLLESGIEARDRTTILRAADHFRRALAVNPRYAAAHLGLAEALLWLDGYDEARHHIEAARRNGRRDGAVDLLEARLAILAGDSDRAAALYEAVLQREPYNPDARVGRAVLAAAGAPTDRVLAELETLSRRYPEHLQLLLALAELNAARNNLAAADRYSQLALQYHGDDASVQLMAARLALDAGDSLRAERHATAATRIAPAFDDAWRVLAAATAPTRPDDALAAWERVIELVPTDHTAWYARGAMAAELDRADVAMTSWRRTEEIRPDFELAHIARENLALTAMPLDDPTRADLARRYRTSGDALFDRFLNRQAERHYRRGLQLNPFDSVLRQRLAELYLQQGFRARYLRELQLVVELGDDGSETVLDAIEAMEAALADSVARRWNVDQFTLPRPRTRIAIFYAGGPAQLPGADAAFARYLSSLVTASQNLDVVLVDNDPGTAVDATAAARAADADLAVRLALTRIDDQVRGAMTVQTTGSGALLSETVIQRSGNGRLDSAAALADERIDALVEPRGRVVDRSFERILVSLGRVDGLEPETLLTVTAPDGTTVRGTAQVTAVDDLVAEARFVPGGRDTASVGDTVVMAVEAATDEPAAEEAAEAGLLQQLVDRRTAEPDVTVEAPIDPSLQDVVERLFRLP